LSRVADSQNEDKMFEQSLYVHSTVVSVDEASGKRVLDAGAKAVDLVRAVWRSVTEEE